MSNRNEGNVLQLMNYGAPYKGNFIQSLLNLESRLNKIDIEMIYLFQKETAEKEWAKELLRNGKKIYFLSGILTKDFRFIRSLVLKHDIKIIHTHFIGGKYNFLLVNVNRTLKKKFFIVRHFHNPYKRRNSITEYFKTIVVPVDLTIGCSKAVADDYMLKKKDKNERVEYVTNAIDFSRLENYKVLQKEDLQINKKGYVFLVFGFEYYRKGVDVVINALEELIKDNIDVYMILSLAANKEFVEKKIIERFNTIPYWIKIVPPIDDIATYYRFSDAFISASRSEGFCYSLVEAAYCGTQIIASDIFAQRDLLIPYTYQFPSEDFLQLKKQMLLAISIKADEKNKRSQEQEKYVIQTFNLDKWSEQIDGIYKSLQRN